MPLDPIMKAFLDQMAAQEGPQMYELPPAQAREMFAALMQLAGPKDVPIGKVANLTCPGPGGDIPLRIYTPVAAGGEVLPALVFFHGGGWVIGNIDTHDGLCRMFANEAGVTVISVEYRLAPEHKFPAAIEDAYAAVTWIEANASDIGIDPNRLAVGGDSAGGGLAASVAQIALKNGGPTIDYQMLLFPVARIGSDTNSMRERAKGYFLERAALDWFFAHYLGEDADRSDPRMSPLAATDVAGLPPAYIMVAGFDPLHDEGVEYAEKLKAAGVSVSVAEYPDLVHDFIYLQAVLPQAPLAVKGAAAALRGALMKG
ncbi:MAG: alpha/beta hydrolase [Rhizomicrobium sp.]|jgi:acetyl esterase